MILAALSRGWEASGFVPSDAVRFLALHEQTVTARHCARVATQAGDLAERFGVARKDAETAGWLHDISAVIPNAQRLQAALENGLEVLPEERVFPMILHQKLSAFIARELFGVSDAAVLNAIGCHTTLKQDASPLDKVVFVADKIAWDQPGAPPYLGDLEAALETSLDAAARVYLEFLWRQRGRLPVLHPWVADAYRQLSH